MTIEGIKSTEMSFQTANSVAKINSEIVKESAENNTVIETDNSRIKNADIKKSSSTENQNNNARAEENKASVDVIKRAVDELNKTSNNSTVQFGVHEKTNRMTIKILDKDTRKVVKEFPAEKSLDLIAKAMEMAGILIDEKR